MCNFFGAVIFFEDDQYLTEILRTGMLKEWDSKPRLTIKENLDKHPIRSLSYDACQLNGRSFKAKKAAYA